MPLITFEGINGSGKSQQVEGLKRFLQRQGFNVLVFREPGGTSLGEDLREVVVSHREDSLSPLAELMVYLASRAELVEKRVKPALDIGAIVILDRYICSSVAYQGWVQGIGIPRAYNACLIATQNLKPDMVIYLDVDTDVALKRVNQRDHSGQSNRYYDTTIQELTKIKMGYNKWYELFCDYPYTRVDADKNIAIVSKHILEAVWNEQIIPSTTPRTKIGF